MAAVIQIDGYDPVGGAPVTLRAASHDDPRVCHIGDMVWWPAVAKLPNLRLDLFDGSFSAQITSPTSSLSLQIEQWPDFGRYALANARIQLWTGEFGAAWANWTQRVDGRISNQPKVAGGVASIDFGVDDSWLDAALLATYAGTTGIEGPADLKGQAKPLALGAPRYVSGKLIDSINSVFQISAYGAIRGVEAALEKLARFDPSIGDCASYAELVAADIPEGKWATALAAGLARFGAPPTGTVSFLVQGDVAGTNGWARLPGQLIRRLAIISGGGGKIDDATLNALDVARPYNLSLYIDEQATARDLIQRLAASVNAVAGVSWMGKLFVLPIGITAPKVTLSADGSTLPPVRSVEQIENAAPWQKLAIGAARAWTVHQLADIAFTATLVDVGAYNAVTIYREGNIVSLSNGSRWLYVNTVAAAGHTPGTDDTYWSQLNPPITAGDINYDDGTPLEDLKPAQPGADVTGGNTSKDSNAVGGRPAATVLSQIDQLIASNGSGDLTPPSTPTGFAMSSSVVTGSDGTTSVDLTASWNPNPEADLSTYTLSVKQQGGNPVEFVLGGAATSWRYPTRPGQIFTGKLKAVDKAGNSSGYTAESTTTTTKDAVPPAIPTGLAVTATYQSAFLTWTNPGDVDLAGASVQLYSSTGTLVSTFSANARPGATGTMELPNLAKATSYRVAVAAIDTSGNASAFSAQVTFTTAGGIVTADLTPGITAPAYGSTLPSPVGYTGPALFFNTTDGRLYRFGSGAWSSSVDGDDVASADNAIINADFSVDASHWTFSPNSATAVRRAAVAGDPASYVRVTSTSSTDAGNGYITTDRTPIPAGATKLYGSYWKRSSVAGQQVAFDAYFYDAAGTQVGYARFSSFAGGANTWTQVTQDLNGNPIVFAVPAGAATFALGPAVVVSPGATQDITLMRMSATQLGATVGAPAGTLVGGTDAATLEARANDPAARVNAMTTTISGGKITTGSITALQIQAATITGDKIVAGAITTALLAAGAITASKLAVGNTTNLVRDPNFQDPSYWTNSGVVAGPMPFKVNAPGWYYGIDANGQAATNLTDFVTLWSGNQSYGTAAQVLTSGVTPIQAGTVYELSATVANASNQTIWVTATTTASNGNSQDYSLSWPAGTTSRQSLQLTTTGVISAVVKVYNNGAPQAAFSGVVRAGGFSLLPAAGATLIQDGAITTAKIVAGAISADKLQAGSITTDKFSTTAALPGTMTIGTTGVQIGTMSRQVIDGLTYTDTRNDNQPPSYYYAKGMVTVAEFKAASTIGITTGGYCQMVSTVQWGDPSGGPVQQEVRDANGTYWNRVSTSTTAWGPWKDTSSQVNASTTQIDPGKITIAGATTLRDWRGGGDLTQINGGAVAANTLTANKLTIGNRGIVVQDFNFQANPATGQVSWTSGVIGYINDAGQPVYVVVSAGSTGTNNSYAYIYWNKDATTLSVGYGIGDAIGDNKIHMATYQGGSTLVVTYGGTIIDGDRITTGSITAVKLNVGSLSAISANIGTLVSTNSAGGTCVRDGNGSRLYNSAGQLLMRWGSW